MALIKCSECEKEISDKATSCPNCGVPMKSLKEESEPTSKPVAKEGGEKSKTGLHAGIGIAILAVIAIIIFVATQSGGGSRPANIGDRIYGLGVAAVEAVDEYLDGRISVSAAEDRVRNSYNGIQNHVGDLTPQEVGVSTRTLTLSMELMDRRHGRVADEDVLEARNRLAESLGLRQR